MKSTNILKLRGDTQTGAPLPRCMYTRVIHHTSISVHRKKYPSKTGYTLKVAWGDATGLCNAIACGPVSFKIPTDQYIIKVQTKASNLLNVGRDAQLNESMLRSPKVTP